MSQTLFDKIWNSHKIKSLPTGEDLIAIDRIFLHERTGSVALESMIEQDRRPLMPDNIFVTMDHIVSTRVDRQSDSSRTPDGGVFIQATRKAAKAMGINLIDVLSKDQGIVHVVSPELGIAQPGLTLVCPDSHTCSQGALGALAWGIGSTDAEHAMVTGTMRVKKPQQMRIRISGHLRNGVTAKDVILNIIAKLGADGAKRCAVEFCGEVVETMDVEARLTLCNMAVEFAAFTAIIAPDEMTYGYLKGRRHVPKGDLWADAYASWKTLYSDEDSFFDYEHIIDCNSISPTVTWGISPEHAASIDDRIPNHLSSDIADYTGLRGGEAMSELKVDVAFIGSCTNARLSDLRAAAEILKGRKVAKSVEAIVVPGSMSVKRAAEAEGLDKIFLDAGFSWNAAGCAFCFFAGGDTFAPGARVISSTNRNFKNRQGPRVRTHLASPSVVAASAVTGRITDPNLL